MSTAAQQIVNKAWNFAHVLRDDGLSYMAYTEQIRFLESCGDGAELTRLGPSRAGRRTPSLQGTKG